MVDPSAGRRKLPAGNVQNSEERVEVHAGEERAGTVEVSHGRMGGAVGVELDPHGRFELYAFRRPVADHELGKEAREFPFQVLRIGRKDLDLSP